MLNLFRFSFEYLNESDKGKLVELLKPVIVVGSGEQAEIVISRDRRVAPRHLQVNVWDYKVEISPLEGNSVYVNDELIESDYCLNYHDVVKVGKTQLRLECEIIF